MTTKEDGMSNEQVERVARKPITMERLENLYAWAVAWDAAPDPIARPDLIDLAAKNRAEFRATVAAHVAALTPTPQVVETVARIVLMPKAPETARRWWTMQCQVCGIEEGLGARECDMLDRRDLHNLQMHPTPTPDVGVLAEVRALCEHRVRENDDIEEDNPSRYAHWKQGRADFASDILRMIQEAGR